MRTARFYPARAIIVEDENGIYLETYSAEGSQPLTSQVLSTRAALQHVTALAAAVNKQAVRKENEGSD
jgi:hypothetical protein